MQVEELKTLRQVYGETLAELGRTNPRIVVLDADISKSTCTYKFAQEHPNRFFNMGVAEQNMFGVAAGLATVGKVPIVSTYAVFASMRACEQVRTSIAYPNLNVKIAVTHGGIEVGWDGATHQAIEDIAIMRAIPNMTVVVPADGPTVRAALQASVRHTGPVYLRMSRNPVPEVYPQEVPFQLGRAIHVKEGTDLTVVAAGTMVSKALDAAQMLEAEGVSAAVLDMHTVKPLDEEVLLRAARLTGAIVTVEDHSIIGGLGSAVAEFLSEVLPVPVVRIGLRDVFGESGAPEALFVHYGLDEDSIAKAARKVLGKKRDLSRSGA